MQKAYKKDIYKSGALRIMLMSAGIIFVALGTAGMFLPLLPSVKFFALAAFCFVRSSEKFHLWLLNSKWYGPIISNFNEGRGITTNQKICVMLIKILIALYLGIFVFEHFIWRILLALAVIAIGIYILRIPTLQRTKPEKSIDI